MPHPSPRSRLWKWEHLTFCLTVFISRVIPAGEIEGTVRFPAGVDGRVSPAVVYVATKGMAEPPSGQSIVIDQNKVQSIPQFVPRVAAMALGGTIVFRNSDNEAHNVNAHSRNDCCSFNYMMRGGGAEEVRPQRAGVVQLLCNIHQYMRGFVVVCPNSLFAITDEKGQFTIENVPDGTHKIVVWQELSKRFTGQLEVSGHAQLDVELERSPSAQLPTAPVRTQPALAWGEVVQRIANTLDAAIRAAQQPDGAGTAQRLARDAYFEHFEANELETAIRLYRGEERVFVLERMFAQIRKPALADLANGQVGAREVRRQVKELTTALEEDVRDLQRRGVFDRRSLLVSAPSGPLRNTGPAGLVDVPAVLTDIRRAFDGVEGLATSGDCISASDALANAYLDHFDRIEPALAARSFAQMHRIETGFLELRRRLKSGMTADTARAELNSLWGEIQVAADALDRSQRGGVASAVNGFSNAFVILTREGVEALLIITALLLYLNRVGRPEGKRAIYAGVVAALFATGLSWAALQWLIADAGSKREVMEGAVALLAAGLLFYVSYWLISKAEARRWQEFLTRQLGEGVSRGSWWTLAMTAFLAVYREGAETMFMFQPVFRNPARSELVGASLGIAAALVALVAIFWGLRFATFRMTIRPFFRVTGALLFVLAVVFAGKGVTELQEAGVVVYTRLPATLESATLALPLAVRDALGLGLSLQSLAVQCAFLGGAVVSLAAMWLLGRLAPLAPVTRNVPATSALRHRDKPPGDPPGSASQERSVTSSLQPAVREPAI